MKGFLHVENGKLTDGNENILLTGVGLGNWLLPEGYMWQFQGSRADRPRRIESVIRELTGSDYAGLFWTKFRNRYITESDIKQIAELGFNSIRIPMNARLFMAEEPAIKFIDEGFNLLEKCIRWCEKYGLYAILDLHGAPGGQTGANIDDCIDDVPRLFTDRHNYEKCIALWRKIAGIYRDDPVVGGYDLLNEPLEPTRYDMIDSLCEFYNDCIKAIREIDTNHLISIEGAKWATDMAVFEKVYDPNMLIHFHRYWCETTIEVYKGYIELGKKLNLPLWLGESGENNLEWYRAMFPMALENGISWNFWPWKRMKNKSAITSEVKQPQNWDKIKAYIEGGVHPGYSEAQKILDEYLDNILFENTIFYQETVDALFGK